METSAYQLLAVSRIEVESKGLLSRSQSACPSKTVWAFERSYLSFLRWFLSA